MRVLSVLFMTALAACGGREYSSVVPSPISAPAAGEVQNGGPSLESLAQLSSSPIKHIVIVIQENRTPDNLFQGLPGADIASSGLNSKGERVPLAPVPFEAPYDLGHAHTNFLTEYDGGRMDGFDQVFSSRRCQNKQTCAYGYVPASETKPYFDLATQYVFADRMFETNEGPSFPAHQYLISGTSSTDRSPDVLAVDNPFAKHDNRSQVGGCDAPADALVNTIDPQGEAGDPVFPCFDRQTLGDLLDHKNVSWRYYQFELGPGLWHAYDAIRHVRYGRDYANVVAPSNRILSDIARGKLADVSWVVPSGTNSDHAGNRANSGPAWVASIVNAMGQSKYWNDCAIFITWDDWGGWYDHVKPPARNSNELGFRVPLIVVSPYAARGRVTHTQYEFGSILKFVEDTFKTGSLNATDRQANAFEGVFDFGKPGRAFSKIAAPPVGPDNGDGFGLIAATPQCLPRVQGSSWRALPPLPGTNGGASIWVKSRGF